MLGAPEAHVVLAHRRVAGIPSFWSAPKHAASKSSARAQTGCGCCMT
jgi:hypothetical protein